jgi:hypothetical protein
MPAIITRQLRKILARNFFDGFNLNSNNYYVGIGRPEQWDSSDNVPAPEDTITDIGQVRDQLISVKRVQAVSQVVPRNNWSSGSIYSQYDDLVSGYPTNPYYIKNDQNQVYICLETGRDANGNIVPSTVEPLTPNDDSFRLGDNYVWKFLYTISAGDANSFMSSNFMPVKVQGATDSNSTGIEIRHASVQNHTKPAMITSLILTDGGTGFTNVPSVTITSPSGTGASAYAYIDSGLGIVTHIEMKGDSSTLAHGRNYFNVPNVTIAGGGGSGATARAVVAPDSGVGRDAREDLRSTAVMFHSQLLPNDSDFIVGQDFRQVSLWRDPRQQNGVLFTDLTGNALDKLTVSSTITSFTRDKKMQGQTSLAVAYVDHIDSNEIYYHQTDSTGFLAFQDGEALQETNGAGDAIIDSALISPKYDDRTGDILYIDNRAAILRDATQTEDVKIIISF